MSMPCAREILLLCVRWSLAYSLSEHDRWARMAERGIALAQTPLSWWLRQVRRIASFPGSDPDSLCIRWTDSTGHQHLTFPVPPDPVRGMHSWHQKVTVERAPPAERPGDGGVAPAKAHASDKEWLATTRPASGPGGVRRPLWFTRPLPPAPERGFVNDALCP